MKHRLLLITVALNISKRGGEGSVTHKNKHDPDHNRYGNETLIFYLSNYLITTDRLWLASTTSRAAALSQQLQPRLASPPLVSFLPAVCSTVAASLQPPSCLQETICSRDAPKWPAKLRPCNKGSCDVLKSYRERSKGGWGADGWLKKKKAWPQQLHFFLSLALICSREQQMILRHSCEDCIFFSFICLSDINYIFIYRICKKELRNVGEGKVIKN